jgi:hypothetical protein
MSGARLCPLSVRRVRHGSGAPLGRHRRLVDPGEDQSRDIPEFDTAW